MKLELVKVEVRTERSKRFNSRGTKPRIYVWEDGESVLDNLVNRRSRPTQLYKEFIPSALKELGLPLDTKVVWNQQAGCRCGCSPGFIVQKYYSFYDPIPVVSVTVRWIAD